MGKDLTESGLPLIILRVLFFCRSLGEGLTPARIEISERSSEMKVSIYKGDGPPFAILLEASPGKGRPPVLLPQVSIEDLVGTVGPEIAAMRLPKGVSPAEPG